MNRINYLQIIMSVKAITLYPERGYIYDRNGVLLVSNQRAFDLMVVPRQSKKWTHYPSVISLI